MLRIELCQLICNSGVVSVDCKHFIFVLTWQKVWFACKESSRVFSQYGELDWLRRRELAELVVLTGRNKLSWFCCADDCSSRFWSSCFMITCETIFAMAFFRMFWQFAHELKTANQLRPSLASFCSGTNLLRILQMKWVLIHFFLFLFLVDVDVENDGAVESSAGADSEVVANWWKLDFVMSLHNLYLLCQGLSCFLEAVADYPLCGYFQNIVHWCHHQFLDFEVRHPRCVIQI